MNDPIEKLAQTQHLIWAHWMDYMFTQGIHNSDGSWTMPPDKVKRWTHQLETPYEKLSPREQQSDRDVIWDNASYMIAALALLYNELLNEEPVEK